MGRTRQTTIIAALVGLIAVGAGVASIPDSDGTISACYLKTTGALRVIDVDVQSCRATEESIDWSQTGKGTPGPAGPRGPRGPMGPAGTGGSGGSAGSSGGAATTATLATRNTSHLVLEIKPVLRQIVGPGYWVAIATVTAFDTHARFDDKKDVTSVACWLQGGENQGDVQGLAYTADRRVTASGKGITDYRSLTLNGGIHINRGGALIVACGGQGYVNVTMTLIRVGSFT